MSGNRIIHDGLRVITRFTHSRTEGSKQNRRKEEGAVVWVGRCQREASSLSLSWNSEDKHKLGKRNWVKRTGLRCSLDILSCFISCCCRCSFPIGRFSSSRNSLLHQPCGITEHVITNSCSRRCLHKFCLCSSLRNTQIFLTICFY